MKTKAKLAERRTLEQCEQVIEESLVGCRRYFVEAGRCLDDIKNRELYKLNRKYGDGCTWEKYCAERWHISKSYADKLIESALVIDNLTIGDPGHHLHLLPSSEKVTRPLAQLAPEDQPEAWQEALERADGVEPTARIVQGVVDQFKTPKPKPAPKPEPDSSESDSKSWNAFDNPPSSDKPDESGSRFPKDAAPQPEPEPESEPEIPKANLKKLVGVLWDELWDSAMRDVPDKQELEVAKLFLDLLHKKFPELKGS